MRPVAVIGGVRRRCAACLLPLAVVVVPPGVVPPVRATRRPAAPCRGQRREESGARATRRLPLAEDKNLRGAALVCPPVSKDVRDGRRRGGSDGC